MNNTSANVHLAQSLLEPLGYKIPTPESAREGIEIARRTKPDLIVPTFTCRGRTVTIFKEWFRGIPASSRFPSSSCPPLVWSIRERETALARGARKFISRPIDAEALISELEECLPAKLRGRSAGR